MAHMRLVGNLHAACGDRFKFGEKFIDDNCHTGETLEVVMVMSLCAVWVAQNSVTLDFTLKAFSAYP
jgi:hypothetical protein